MNRALCRWLRIALALVLAFAPVLPGMAYVERGVPDHAAHASDAGEHAYHGTMADEKASPCAQHDGCQGQCCATCVQCFTATMYVPAPPPGARPVQFATVHTLLDSLLVSFLNRPPSAA